jgi:hypothetical protein
VVQKVGDPGNGFVLVDAVENEAVAGLYAFLVLAEEAVEMDEGALAVLVELVKELVTSDARG